MNVRDVFEVEYRKAFYGNTSQSLTRRKREALQDSVEKVPEAGPAFEAWKRMTAEHRTAQTVEEMLGSELMVVLGTVVGEWRRSHARPTKYRHYQARQLPMQSSQVEPGLQALAQASEESREPSNGELESDEAGHVTVQAIYEAWVKESSYVPSDMALAYFSGRSRGAFGLARNQLKKQGWVFDRGPYNGWVVKSRPSAQATAPKSVPPSDGPGPYAIPGISAEDVRALLRLAQLIDKNRDSK